MWQRGQADKDMQDHEILVALRERSYESDRQIRELNSHIDKEIEGLKAQVRERTRMAIEPVLTELQGMKDQVGRRVTYERFRPVELITFGIAASVMAAVMAALIALVVAQPGKSAMQQDAPPPPIRSSKPGMGFECYGGPDRRVVMVNKRLNLTKLLHADPLAAVDSSELLIAELHLKGMTATEIAGATGIPLDEARTAIGGMEKHWAALIQNARADKIAKETAKLGLLEREAWRAWHRSVGPVETVTVKTGTGGEDEYPSEEKTVRTEHQAGDSKYLKVIHSCINSRRRLFGLDAPVKVASTDPTGEHESRPLAAIIRLPAVEEDADIWAAKYGPSEDADILG